MQRSSRSIAYIAAASVPVSRIFSNSTDGAVATAWVVCAYLVALVPFGVLMVIRRAFFAFQDTRTPFWFGLAQAIATAIGALLAWAAVALGLLPLGFLAAGVALTQSLATLVQLPLAVRLLRRHSDTAALRPSWRALGRFALAAVPAFAAGWATFLLMGGAGGWAASDRLLGAVGAAIVGGVSILVYVAALALLRAPELAIAQRTVRRMLGR